MQTAQVQISSSLSFLPPVRPACTGRGMLAARCPGMPGTTTETRWQGLVRPDGELTGGRRSSQGKRAAKCPLPAGLKHSDGVNAGESHMRLIFVNQFCRQCL